MQVLDKDESWELFLKKAFPWTNNGKCPDQDMENIGRQILKSCGGLPLAIIVAGGLLVNQSKSKWEEVLKAMDSHLRQSKHSVYGILELSYLNLPPQLKSCFLCLGFFKEDATIRAKKLVDIWITEGLVPKEGGKRTMEEIGRSYLDELISRNLIQVKEMTMDDQVKSCHMHDLLHKLSITKAEEEISFEILSADDQGNSQSLHKPRHLVVYYNRKMFRLSKNQRKCLRSILFYGGVRQSPSKWKNYELLRVLEFEGIPRLPKAIGRLISLRYLCLRNTGVYKLPSSLGRLKKLEVLDISKNGWVLFPDVIWKLEGLRHLYADGIESKAPLKTDTLKNIQTLSRIFIESLVLEDVTRLTSLRKLGIIVRPDSPNISKLYDSLAKLEHFVSLTLKVSGISYIGHREVDSSAFFHGVGILHRLTKLKLWGRSIVMRVRLPSASDFPPNLSHLVLARMAIHEDAMVILEKLPQLSYLKLDGVHGELGEMVISHDRFPKLRVLVLRFMWRFWKHIKVERDARLLKRLEFHHCGVTAPDSIREELKIETDVDIFC